MLTYDLEQRGSIPLYEYLYSQIRGDILSGSLPGGTPLPSKRSFALQLGISTITVENAYAQLQAEGYICSRPRRGFFVADADELEMLRPYTLRSLDGEQQQMNTSSVMPRNNPVSEQPLSRAVFADLAGNQTDPALFPFSNWARLTRRILSERQEDLMRNAPSEGVYELREAIAGILRDFRGMQVTPEQIIIGAGTEFLYGLLIQLLGFDQTYANENPGYARPSAVFAAYGVRHVRLPLDEGGISLQALEKSGANVVHVTPAHHFPTGLVTGPERRAGLLRWASRGQDRYLIEDDYDSEMTVQGHSLLPLFAADHTGSVIYMNTFTKSLAPTIRISYMVLPPDLLALYRKKLGFYSSPVPVSDQYVLAAFLSEGYFEVHINRMRNYARRKREALLSAFRKETLSRYFTVDDDHAGMEFLITLTDPGRSKQFEEELSRNGIRMKPLTDYYADSENMAKNSGCYVMNYSSLPLTRIEETAERMRRSAEKAAESDVNDHIENNES